MTYVGLAQGSPPTCTTNEKLNEQPGRNMEVQKDMKPSMSFFFFHPRTCSDIHIICLPSLEDLRQRQAIQNPQKPFLTPSLRKKSKSRLTPFEIKINTMYDSWRTGPTGVWKLDSLPPILQIVKDRFPTELEWLWRRCNEALDPRDDSIDMTPAERAKVLGLVLVSPRRGALTPYPLRPSGSLGSSESVDELRAILARAPECRGKDGEIAGMVRHETCHPEWDVWYDWDGDYYDEVFQALMEVVKQHGVGDEGWASARWEVYDTVGIHLT